MHNFWKKNLLIAVVVGFLIYVLLHTTVVVDNITVNYAGGTFCTVSVQISLTKGIKTGSNCNNKAQ